MDLRQLRQVAAIIDHGSIGRAAERLNLSQPALTKSIRKLEQELQVKLFDRENLGMRPTMFGECLGSHARTISNGVAKALAEVKGLQSGIRGIVTIGCPNIVASELLSGIVLRLSPGYPGLQFRILPRTEGLEALLRDGQLDFLVNVVDDDPPAGMRQKLLFNDPLIVVARRDHLLAAQRRRVLPRELAKASWILPIKGNFHRMRLEAFFLASGLQPPTAAIECSRTEFIKAAVMQSDLLGVVAEIAMNDATGLARIATNSPLLSRPMGLVWRQDTPMSAGTRLTMEAIETELSARFSEAVSNDPQVKQSRYGRSADIAS